MFKLGLFSTLVRTKLYPPIPEDINNNISYSKIVPIQYSNLSDEQLGNKINIYPNPVSSNLSVDIDVATSETTIYNIKLVTTAGVIVREIISSGPFWQGSVGNLQPGTYILRVFNQDTQTL